MQWLRRRERDTAVQGGLDAPRMTFPELLVWVGVVLFFLLTLLPIFFPTWVPPSFGFAEVGTPGSSGYVPPKTLWDWFSLVAIPLAIVVVGYVLNRADRNHERRLQDQRLEESRELEQNRTQDAIVKDYLDQMTDLLLNHSLRISAEGAEVRSVARARTLTALRGVDGERKATIVRFLYEAQLIGYFNGEETVAAVVQLHESNLRGASFNEANLTGANLRKVNLTGANLTEAWLFESVLQWANLLDADLRGASLSGADLHKANLTEAWLRGTNFQGANLRGATLDGAKLTDCQDLTLGRLREAKSLHGTTLPDHINPADLGDKWSPPKPENTPEPQP